MHRAVFSLATVAVAFLFVPSAGSTQTSPERVVVRELAQAVPQPDALLSRPANLTVRNAPMAGALQKLFEASGTTLAFSPSQIDSKGGTVSCECATKTVGEALDLILGDSPFTYLVLQGQVLVHLRPTIDLAPIAPISPSTAFLGQPGGSLDIEPALALATPAPVLPQQDGNVTGVVLNQRSRNPLASVAVSIADLGLGVASEANGRYLLQNVPAGTHLLTVELIGYGTETREVTVSAQGTAVADFLLIQEAFQLDEIVVTGTAGGQRVRELGNSVARLDASVFEDTPNENLSRVLTARAPGVVVQQGSGSPGTASTIKLRGSSSMQLTNDGPLLYIDGVRMNNRITSGSFAEGNVSRIDDLDPENIQSIEVIKGPAAATLYGTEASNGVIQIVTKRGLPGDAQWQFETRQGASWFRDPAGRTPINYGMNAETGQVEGLNLMENEEERDALFQYGHNQYYGLNVSGGTEAAQYYVAASASDDEGAVRQSSWGKRYTGQLNISARAAKNLTFTANSAAYFTENRYTTSDPYFSAVFGLPEYLGTERRGFFEAPPEAIFAREDYRHKSQRMMFGLTTDYTPRSWFTHRLTFGLDFTSQESNQLNNRLSPEFAQFYSTFAAAGSKSVDREGVLFTTTDYATSVSLDDLTSVGLPESLSITTSAGFQLYTKKIELVSASGQGFPAHGLESVGSAGSPTGTDDIIENNTIGFYLQQQFGWNDRLFLTGALRFDENSAFGADFGRTTLPKVSGSWVLSEESFWGLDFANSFRLRAAWGQSATQPDVFDALRSFVTRDAPGGGATVRPDATGNPELGPEIGEEVEIGFEAGLLDDRVALDFTFYDQRTTDAIVARNVPPSSGFTGQQVVNIGEISNRGVEATLLVNPVRRQNLDWNLGINLSTNRNRIEQLGLGEESFLQLGWTTRHAEGYPVGSFFAPEVVSATLDDDGLVQNVMCNGGSGNAVDCAGAPWLYQGHPDPNLEGAFTTSVRLFDRLELSALVQGKFGQTKYDLQGAFRWGVFQTSELNWFPERYNTPGPVGDPKPYDITDVAEAQIGVSSLSEADLWVNSASFVRFKELALSYDLPEDWMGSIGAERGLFTVSARNLGMLWTNWPAWPFHDPEVFEPARAFSGNREPVGFTQVPPLTSFSFGMRLGF